MFKIYKAEIENSFDKNIKFVRSDRGGDFYGNMMKLVSIKVHLLLIFRNVEL